MKFTAKIPKQYKEYKVSYRSENKACGILKRQEYQVIKLCKSKLPFDIMAFNPVEIKLIQVKTTKLVRIKSYKEIIARLKKIQTPFLVSKELWINENRRGFQYIQCNK